MIEDLEDFGTSVSDISLKIIVEDEVFLNAGIRNILNDFENAPNGCKIDMFTSAGKQVY